jgi:DNA modification methylase
MEKHEFTQLPGTLTKLKISEVIIPQEMSSLYDYACRQNEIDTLKTSIEEFGQLEPITVVKVGNQYFIINGVLRLMAFSQFHLLKNEIDAMVLNIDTTSEDFNLMDLIIHTQIQKVKTVGEKIKEFISILRLDSFDTNPLRDRNKRYEFLSKSLGRGWSRSNVIITENVLKFEKEHGDHLKLVEKVFSGLITTSKAEDCMLILQNEDYKIDMEIESGILKGYLDKLITKDQINKKIDDYLRKKNIPLTNLGLVQINTEDCLILEGDNKKALLPEDKMVNLALTSITYKNQVNYGDSPEETGHEENIHEYIENVLKPFEINYDRMRDDSVLVINFNESYEDGFCLDVESKLKARMKEIGYKYLQPVIWNKSKTGKPKQDKVRRLNNQFEYVLVFTKTEKYFFNPIKIPNSKKKCQLTRGAKEQNGKKSTHISNQYDTIQDFCSENVVSDVITLTQNSKRIRGKSVSDFFGGFPTLFPVPFILTFCPEGKDSIVWDPYGGEGTTACQSLLLGRSAIINELYPKNVEKIKENVNHYITQLVDINRINELHNKVVEVSKNEFATFIDYNLEMVA